MRRALILVILLSLVLSETSHSEALGERFDIASIKSYRDIPEVTEEEISAIEALKETKGSFSYGCLATTEAFILPDGTYAGFSIKLCELFSSLFGIEFVPAFYKWDALKSGIDNKSIDFTGQFTLMPARMQVYYMTHPVTEHPLQIFTNIDTNEVLKESDINGYRVGFLKGATTAELIRKAYPSLLFEVIEVDSFVTATEKLKSGEIDAFVTEAIADAFFENYNYIRSKELFPLVYTPNSIATANVELKPIISVVNKYISAGGINKLYELSRKGDEEYARYKLNRSFTDEEKAYMDDLAWRGAKVSLALESENYPVCFYNETEREFQGIALDVLAEISELTGIEFEAVTNKDTPWTEILEKLKTGEISMVTQLLYSDARKDNYIWSSEPYASSYYALLSKSDYPDLENYQVVQATVGTVIQSGHEDMYNTWFPGSNNTVRFNTQNEAFDALEKGDIDLVMASEYMLLNQTNYREKPGYKINVRFNAAMNSLFGLNKNEEVLRSIIDKAQAYVKTGTIESGWTKRVFDYSRKYAQERTIYLTIFIAFLFLVSVTILLLYLKNRRISTNLERQAATLSTIYTSIPDLVFCKDTNYNYTSCNLSFEEFAGRKEADIVGRNSVELFTIDGEMALHFMEADIEVISKNTMKMAEEWFTYPDHSRRLFETIKTPLTQNGVVIGLLGISRDITEHKAAEEAARAASKAKSTFLANMSHEIRTPINAITGMAELILRRDIPHEIYENVLGIKHAGANLLSIINDILDFSKIEAGKLEIVSAEYSFASLINDVLSIIRMRISEKLLMFVVNIDCNIPNTLIGDEARLRQILLNIIGNAVKYTDEGFISVAIGGDIEGDTVVLTFEISDSGIGIKEKDLDRLFGDFVRLDMRKNKGISGAGLGLAISRDLCWSMGGDISVYSEYGVGSTFTVTIPQIFYTYEKFASVENPDKKRVLVYEPRSIYADSIVCSIDNLGVRCTLVWTQSQFYEELRGKSYSYVFVASFLYENVKHVIESLELDCKVVLLTEFGEIVTEQNVRAIATPVHSVSIANILNDVVDDVCYHENHEIDVLFIAPSARILIVDDVATNLKVAEGLMLPYEMQIDVCKSGAEAIKLAKQNRYDLIFMDHMMPGMDGIEAANIVRALEDESGCYKNVPIIALTANAVSGMKEMFLQNGLDDFLAKPIEISKLNGILEKWIPLEKREKYIEEKPEPAPVTFEIDGIDVKTGISMTGGTVDNYLKTLAVFYKDVLEKINQIRDCVKKNDIALYTTYVHALKSASASIGAGNISNFARALEMAGKSEAVSVINENTERFLAELETLLRNIQSILPSHEYDSIEESNSDLEFLKNELLKLKDALESMDARTIGTIMNGLEAKTWDAKTNDAIENISKLILLFEYDEAINVIDGLL